jgi:hypothetical protein
LGRFGTGLNASLTVRKAQERLVALFVGPSGFVVLSGLNLRLPASLFDEVSFGWGQQQPIDDRFEPIEGPLLKW